MDLISKTRLRLELLTRGKYQKKRYVVGVSGGKDSQCLLHLLALLIPSKNLTIAHVNYALRGKDSEKDETLVRQTCKKLGLKLLVHHPETKNTSELSLRNLRRSYFKQILKNTQSHYIVLAHHAQDQLETILMRLIRGTGVVGLSGIQQKNGAILRPLLTVSPEEIEQFLSTHKIKYRTDETNFHPKYFRNHVRSKIIPHFNSISLRHGGTTALYTKISALSEELHTTRRYFEAKTKKNYSALIIENAFWYRFHQEKFLLLKHLEQKQLIHRLLKKLNSHTSHSRISVERALTSIEEGSDLSLEGGIKLSVSCGQVFLQNKKQILALSKVKGPLSLGVSTEIPAGFELRFPLPGDRFRSGKLKKKLISERIPRLMRKVLPVLARRGTQDVVWFLKA